MLSQRPVVSPPPAPAPGAARANQTTRTKKKKTKNLATTRARTAKKPASKRVRRLPAAKSSSSPDPTLLVGGLALVVLVLGDTIFLALSKKVLRGV
jgi:hypothetical protein